ncbi:P-loop containing nucleoside triphosphate hydrolase protein [Halteromyces radiatus]|uniref:P-loop containing nucleoside triphosphate hydrolase protein n=1 Tax=Halteromyces radiatus TaxID=101107 RepID=UPI00221EA52A|nr:P-loop containing nucleoside triphosphate hydrolase protein [Halteromyces radiatus]KAI8093377.1 P-loop containing nucleoside triphosphate hydrolase protein [Halteromyces radiatus]
MQNTKIPCLNDQESVLSPAPFSFFSPATTSPATVTTTTMSNNQPPASPPATPVYYPSDPISPSSSPSPSSSYSSIPSYSTKSLRPRYSKSTCLASENIQVMVRCRPPFDTTVETQEEDDCWILGSEKGTIKLDDSHTTVFEYDKVFKGTDNAEIYESGIQKLVRSTMEGYNGTVFAYGQTASGKTYTMVTGTQEEPGMIPKAVNDVFAYIEEEAVDREFLLQVAYMEIYKEKINDLLGSEQPATGLIIRTVNGQDSVDGLNIVPVTTPEEVMNYIKLGEARRHTSETDFNESSSRSHTIFQLIIESKPRSSSLASVRTSRLNLIDLAGSEKAAINTERRQEGAFINKSLLTLGKVITQLNEGAKHIPYRDSKLTRILSTSLSGNDRVAVICTINPSWKSKDESTNTLRFAQGVKKVRINPKITQTTRHSKLQNYKEQIVELEIQMQKKTEQEADTKERLSHLLGLILTSSKANDIAKNKHEATAGSDVWLHGSIEDVVHECEQHLSATIQKHQDEIRRKDQDIQQLKDRLAQNQQSLDEKSIVIEELQVAVQDYQRITEERQAQLDKYRNDTAELSKRWTELESFISDYKEQLVVSESKALMLEARRKADEHANDILRQELEECKMALEQKIQDERLLGMVQSMAEDEPEEDLHDNNNDNEKDTSTDHDVLNQIVINLKKQLEDTEAEYERKLQEQRNDMEKEKDRRDIIYKKKIDEVQKKLDDMEAELIQSLSVANTTNTNQEGSTLPMYLGHGNWQLLLVFSLYLACGQYLDSFLH